MEIEGIDPSQIESLQQTPFLEPRTSDGVQEQGNETATADTVELNELARQAEQLPDNRPEVVDRGRDLLADPNYPSADIEDQVARILLGVEEETY